MMMSADLREASGSADADCDAPSGAAASTPPPRGAADDAADRPSQPESYAGDRASDGGDFTDDGANDDDDGEDGEDQDHIIDEYGYTRTKEDLSGDKLGKVRLAPRKPAYVSISSRGFFR